MVGQGCPFHAGRRSHPEWQTLNTETRSFHFFLRMDFALPKVLSS